MLLIIDFNIVCVKSTSIVVLVNFSFEIGYVIDCYALFFFTDFWPSQKTLQTT